MKFEETLNRIRSLNFKKGTYALFGSAPIVVRGIREFSNDIDGLQYVNLIQVLIWKKLKGRPKDIYDVQLIEKYLAKNN